MKKLSFLSGIIFLLHLTIWGQIIPDLKNYDLRPFPKISEIEDSLYSNDKVLGIYYGRIFDYRIENNTVELWECLHVSNKVYDSRSLEYFNIFYLPTVKEENIIDCKARYIARDGSVTVLSKKDLEEIEEDNEEKYKVFRFPTAEIGSIMEYYYIIRREGIRERGSYTPASQRHLKELDFSLIFPNYLNFEITTYNGLPAAKDTLDKDSKIKCIYVHAEEIPKLNKEPMSFYDAHLPRIEFLLTHNYSRNRMRINTINTFATNSFQNVSALDKKEKKTLKKIGSKIQIDNKMSLEQKVRSIENYVKTNFYYYNLNAPALSNLTGIQDFKLFNYLGSIRLFYHLFDYFNIENELVFTSDKTEKAFDKNFDGSNFLDIGLFYFPKLDMFTSPYYEALRLGYPPSAATGQDGLFLKKVSVGGASSFLPSFRYIQPINMELNGDTIEISITLNPQENEISANVRRSVTGYNAAGSQLHLSDTTNLEEEDLIDLEDHYLGLDNESIIINNAQMFNTKKEDILNRPLIFKGELKDYFLCRTNNDSLWVTIGAFIGKQSEFKQETPRVLPVERNSNSHYYRTIRIEIPQGYTCMNISELNTDIYDEENPNNAHARFSVNAKQQENQIIIECIEYYKRLYYPVEEYEKCQRIVNAAAEFNNATLLFKKN